LRPAADAGGGLDAQSDLFADGGLLPNTGCSIYRAELDTAVGFTPASCLAFREPLCWNDPATIAFREQPMKFRKHCDRPVDDEGDGCAATHVKAHALGDIWCASSPDQLWCGPCMILMASFMWRHSSASSI
jgi:hypothetical protein